MSHSFTLFRILLCCCIGIVVYFEIACGISKYNWYYTTFEYSNLKLNKPKVIVGEPVKVSVDIKNTGDREGDEIVQLYIRDKVSSVTRPVKELKDFKRISVASGETKTVEFTITADKLQFYNLNMKRVVEPGEFEVMGGRNSVDFLSYIFNVIE